MQIDAVVAGPARRGQPQGSEWGLGAGPWSGYWAAGQSQALGRGKEKGLSFSGSSPARGGRLLTPDAGLAVWE